MVKKRITRLNLIRKLRSLDRGFFTVSDLEKIFGYGREILKVTIYRLVKEGILIRLKRGVYQLEFNPVNVEKIANQIYYPSYLSFEGALSRYGILSQIPYTQTFATPRKSKKMIIMGIEAEFTQIKKELYYGFRYDGGIYIAEPEKALLDQLYLASRGLRGENIDEYDYTAINIKKFKYYSEKFPKQPKFLNLLSMVFDKLKN
ncbi:hypothetical protein A3D00_01870 [Candidatus Woesebacteria bacterium RIFCSPHIGHO2_02_FULL_38_9]|uniref:AbiEi antitoxin N-terminal domain-containing protein n=1 Tax=Candidatus Woesebacteria bacterium RIFCSPHIGHO2_01_FULL_39_28 TaxID=1802496 RepID=A0A1F7YI25_9BACT|nr:MAG: hypothetical protein A2627_02430 [Candidatus Woesebacteria bacterium RIFCSPHIGHO2_01_FULL_39_28]OGM32198.1 MAG: hypothetical protein A3D00_01870 [Candidatus Woesebacteria bacterium RIFCSPHIGHO2_02_FULL_38_9]OGM57184.1 MAG: hypothetical protein A3A50_03290 [Candidatus Woesebacteria bacterium RIFCSPLOWO2_01_FULL_38_20]